MLGTGVKWPCQGHSNPQYCINDVFHVVLRSLSQRCQNDEAETSEAEIQFPVRPLHHIGLEVQVWRVIVVLSQQRVRFQNFENRLRAGMFFGLVN
jgi:hypothetical protein